MKFIKKNKKIFMSLLAIAMLFSASISVSAFTTAGPLDPFISPNFPIGIDFFGDNYKIKAQGHIATIGWDKSVKGSAVTIGTTGRSLRLEAVKFELDGYGFPKSGGFLGIGAKTIANLNYSVYVPRHTYTTTTISGGIFRTITQTVEGNWYHGSNGQEVGTTGRSAPIEKFKMTLTNAPSGVSLKYKVHIEGMPWTDWLPQGEEVGVFGKRIEAISIIIGNLP